ncbi:hypothetical protein ACLOJK_031942 [Asimina triloba]
MGETSYCMYVMLVVGMWVLVLKMMVFLWWRPSRVGKHFANQGISGPPYRFFIGNVKEIVQLMVKASAHPMPLSHNILPRVLSFYHQWKKIYGATFLVWFGPTARLMVADPDLIREIFVSKSEFYEKYESHPLVRRLEGDGLLSLKGERWAHRRKIITPTFHMENLKTSPPNVLDWKDSRAYNLVNGMTRTVGWVDEWSGFSFGRGEWERAEELERYYFEISSLSLIATLSLLIPVIGSSVLDMVRKWSEISENGEVEIDVSDAFQSLTEDVITRTTFGRSYNDGKAVSQLQAQQMVFAAEAFRKVFIPGYRFLPTKKNTSSWRLDKEIRKSLVKLIQQRNENSDEEKPSGSPVKDLLGLMINARAKKPKENSSNTSRAPSIITVQDIIEECKAFFFAGKQTTSNLLTWTTVLLAMHPQWQELARDEVLQVCGSRDIPTRDDIAKLKTIGMIVNESLRLYPPAIATIRRAKADVELGSYKIPRGTELLIPILAVHHDKALWGDDAAEFNPARFADGVARAAKHPLAFIPFGLGARTCIGQNLAIIEAKLALAIMLKHFQFGLAPSYRHAPTVLMLLYPQYGAPIIFRRLSGSDGPRGAPVS